MLDEEKAKPLARVAACRGRSAEQFAAKAIRRVAEGEADFDAVLQEGIGAAERGELIDRETMEAWFEERVAARRAA